MAVFACEGAYPTSPVADQAGVQSPQNQARLPSVLTFLGNIQMRQMGMCDSGNLAVSNMSCICPYTKKKSVFSILLGR